MPSRDTYRAEQKAKVKAIDDELTRIRTRLDQLVKKAADETFVERDTTEKLTEELTSLRILEEEALKLKNSQLTGRVRKERDRAREALGLVPVRRRR